MDAPFRRDFDAASDPKAAAKAIRAVPADTNGNALINAAYIALTEISDPAAPTTNLARLYVRDNGAGKTQLVVRFPTGAIQVIATEP